MVDSDAASRPSPTSRARRSPRRSRRPRTSACSPRSRTPASTQSDVDIIDCRAGRHLRGVDPRRHRRRLRVEPEPGQAHRRGRQRCSITSADLAAEGQDHLRPRRRDQRLRRRVPRRGATTWAAQQDRAVAADQGRSRRGRRGRRRRAQHHARGGAGPARATWCSSTRPSRSDADYLGGGPGRRTCFAAAEFNKDQGKIDDGAGRDGVQDGSRRPYAAAVGRERPPRRTTAASTPAAVTPTRRPGCALDGVRTLPRRAGGALAAARRLDLDVDAGEFVCARRAVAGAARRRCCSSSPASPRRRRARSASTARPVTGPGADRGVVFQQPTSCIPWLSVRGNVELGPRLRGVGAGRRGARAPTSCSARSASPTFAERAPYELSGGMQQRCQIARVLANDPACCSWTSRSAPSTRSPASASRRSSPRIWRETGQDHRVRHPQRRRGGVPRHPRARRDERPAGTRRVRRAHAVRPRRAPRCRRPFHPAFAAFAERVRARIDVDDHLRRVDYRASPPGGG